MDPRKLRISLERSRFPRAFEENENLWHDEIDRVKRLVKEHHELLAESKCPSTGHYLTIAIFGSYGTGKSSFLRTLRSVVNEHTSREEPSPFFCLPVIERNLMGEDVSFLYAFLASALDADADKQAKSVGGSASARLLSPVQQAF